MRTAFGPDRRILDSSRLRGGTKKGVYRLTLDDDTTAIAYVWDESEDFWPADVHDPTDPFGHASGLELFVAAHGRLAGLGVRVPVIHLIDGERNLALLEDVSGGSLEKALDAGGGTVALEGLAGALDAMHGHTAPGFGRAAELVVTAGGSCAARVLARALDDLDELATRETRITAVRAALADRLHELAAPIPPRTEFSLIHGELGPDHVLVDGAGDPVLIDIEGLMFFDVEWEHVFLRIRFREHYARLHREGLDEHRLAFYELAMRLSLVAGPLRLLDGAFPDREAMRDIAEQNLQAALAYVAEPAPSRLR